MKRLIICLILLLIPSFAFAATEDFTTYTEVDVAANRVTFTATRGTVTDGDRDEEFRLYKDMGSGHFAGDFEHLFTISNNSDINLLWGCFWAMANNVSGMNGFSDAFFYSIFDGGGGKSYTLLESDSASWYGSATYVWSNNTATYMKAKRDEAVGTYGTIYMYVYSDSGRTDLLATQSVTLHTSKKDFQYLYAITSPHPDATGSRDWDGYIENLDLQEAVAAPPNEPVRHQIIIF